MPFDANLTLINGVAMTSSADTPATTTSENGTSKAKVIDLGASILTGSPEGTGVNGISVALICTTSSGSGNLVGYIEASDSVSSSYVRIGTFEDASISSGLTPFHYVIRVFTEMRYIRANFTAAGGTWTNIHVVVGTHHLERL